MLDLDSSSVSEECAMVCTELQYEDVSEDEVVYGLAQKNMRRLPMEILRKPKVKKKTKLNVLLPKELTIA